MAADGTVSRLLATGRAKQSRWDLRATDGVKQPCSGSWDRGPEMSRAVPSFLAGASGWC